MKKWRKSTTEAVISLIKQLIIIGAIVFIIQAFIFIPMTIEGKSMQNTVYQNDHIIFTRFGKIKRQDVIVFQTPSKEVYIKRIIGLPGDEIHYQGDKLYVNDKVVAEPYLKENIHAFHKTVASDVPYTGNFKASDITGTKRIPANTYFVLGDNRNLSKDSRTFGVIRRSQIMGIVRMIYYPFNHFKIF